MATKAYVTRTSNVAAVGDIAGVPKSNQDLVDPKTGKIHPGWWRFFSLLNGPPQQESAVVLGASPTTFTAPSRGQLYVTGGSGLTLVYGRKSTYTLGFTSGFIPLSDNDTLTITYGSAPTVTFFPW